jgi:hypothetical protein
MLSPRSDGISDRLPFFINISSSAHQLGNLRDRTNLNLERANSYLPWSAYGNSKLANILFTKSLAKKLAAKNSKVVVASCHPGVCRTDLGRYIFDANKIPKFLLPVLGVVGSPFVYFTKSAQMGAQTQIYLAASKGMFLKLLALTLLLLLHDCCCFCCSLPLLTLNSALQRDRRLRFPEVTTKVSGLYFSESKVSETTAEARDAQEAEWLWNESERMTGVTFKV